MHGIEISEFEAAFAARNTPAWHNLGTVFEDEVTTDEMLELAHLDNWDVHLRPVTVEGVDSDRFAKQYFATIRTNPFDGDFDALSIVGERYKTFQNEELFDFGQALLHNGGIWESAGSIREGRQVFASLVIPNSITLDPEGANDKVESYLMLTTSHDGTSAIVAGITPVRVVCQNTLNFAINGLKQSFKIRHTQSAEGKIQVARETLGLATAYMNEFEVEAQSMIETEMSNAQFETIFNQLYPLDVEAGKAATTRHENKWEQALDLFVADDENASNENIVGTAWAGLNALTEQGQWFRNPRGGNAESVLAAGSGLDAIANANRNKQRKAVLEFVGA